VKNVNWKEGNNCLLILSSSSLWSLSSKHMPKEIWEYVTEEEKIEGFSNFKSLY
jgi:hypothetical protein